MAERAAGLCSTEDGARNSGNKRPQAQRRRILQLQRKKDQDAYETRKMGLERELHDKKTTLQKEFAEREALIAAREEEYAQLKKTVTLFPEQLEKAVRDAENKATEAIESHYKFKMDLTSKEIEGEKKLNQQIISSLREKIKEQDEYIKQLTHMMQALRFKQLPLKH